MPRILGQRSRFLQQWRPLTDYERWLQEHNENYQVGEDAEYHPSIPGVHGEASVFHRVIDDSPRQRAGDAHPSHSDVTLPQSHKPHGEFLNQLGAGTPSKLRDALTDGFRGHCPYQLALFFVVVIVFLHIVKGLQKQRLDANAPPAPRPKQYVNLQIDEKLLV
ncbi:hypothetical protein OAory_01019300 [Aspergillus oryzae]|uniref:Unnamed protein product n=1 Tax=Aspergillus oryzae TaxID=5062 RepID=A0A1S9DB90_ASPOZ|nr:hypothetical protein OAory_01019300 [Aspergillus oryzae]RAQ42684.1 hypothetical protein AFGD_010017 [Aspergillus flavus]GMG15169.1 unnamed protein product [Aspergillus oryzae]GMG22940.1 unnamed protein product [Aspergillus oryzae]